MGIGFGIYETLNVDYTGIRTTTNPTRAPFLSCLWCGAVAGFWASVLTHPLDLVRRRQQMAAPGSSCARQSTAAIVREIVGKQGFGGLYRGVVPELVKVVPAVGINFWIYEYVRQDLFGSRIQAR